VTRVQRLRLIEQNLLPLVLATAVVGVLLPASGTGPARIITPLLAMMLLCTSLTFDAATVQGVLRRPGIQVLATAMVYGPMGVIGLGLATWLFGPTAIGSGLILVAVLPTDVSSPLLVWIARGDVALATALNAVNTALAPLLVPALFLAYTGIELDVAISPVIAELAVTVIVPTALGVALRTWQPRRIAPLEPLLSAVACLAYLGLLLAVVGPNAATITSRPGTVAAVAAAALALNACGYLLAVLAGPLVGSQAARTALLFTVSKKEFSIAAVVVTASGLPVEVALPAAVYAVVQMITSPLAARRRAGRVHGGW
jgi:bile acid:Na+ symporter, BASS family